MLDGVQLSSGGEGLCKTHQVSLSVGERPVLGRKTVQMFRLWANEPGKGFSLWEHGGHQGREGCMLVFMVDWTIAVGTTSPPWESKQQSVGIGYLWAGGGSL